jgi:uncharacterized protein (DUF1501 family)
MKTRREFLKKGMVGLASTWALPAFLNQTLLQMHVEAADALVQPATGKDGPILVVLQMGGGNDGLNTLVPFDDDAYHAARPTLGIKKDETLKVWDQMGLNPALQPLQGIYDAGNLAVIQGVGYPNPNRSHFRSMEIWHTAADSNRYEQTGWLGRYFDSACAGCDPTVGVNIGSMSPQAFASKSGRGISMANPRSYKFVGESDAEMAAMTGSDEGDSAGGSIGELSGKGMDPAGGSQIDFLTKTVLDAQVSSGVIQKITAGPRRSATYPGSKLANDLRLVADLIAGGLSTRIYYVNQGGYDTHANQRNAHDRQLAEMAGALSAFLADLRAQGNGGRVMVMTFSEFGRRVKENGSQGTDHGTAGPMFLAGGGIKAGLHGTAPSLTDLDNGDLKFTTDFRAVYATIMERWMKTDSQAVLGRAFPAAGFIG